jgi:hypothetical protein
LGKKKWKKTGCWEVRETKSLTPAAHLSAPLCTFVLWCRCCCCRIRLGSSGRSSVRVLFRKCRFLVQFAVVVVVVVEEEEEEEEERGVCCCCCCSLRILTSGAVQQHQLRRRQQKKKKQQQAVGSCVVGRPEFSLVLCDRHDFMRKLRDTDRHSEREREREREREYSLAVTPNCALFLDAGFRVMICGRAVESRQCSLWHLVLELPGCRLFSAIILVGFRVE